MAGLPANCYTLLYFLPRCMECRRGLTMRILSVRSSVCQTRALWENGRKLCLDFYIIRKNIYPSFLRRRMVGGGDPFYPKELLVTFTPAGMSKRRVLSGNVVKCYCTSVVTANRSLDELFVYYFYKLSLASGVSAPRPYQCSIPRLPIYPPRKNSCGRLWWTRCPSPWEERTTVFAGFLWSV